MYYRSTYTNKIVADNFVKCIDYVYGRGTIDMLIAEKVLIPLENPTIDECIIHGSGSVAVVRYRELHPDTSWSDASKEVRRLSKALRKDRYAKAMNAENAENAENMESAPDTK